MDDKILYCFLLVLSPLPCSPKFSPPVIYLARILTLPEYKHYSACHSASTICAQQVYDIMAPNKTQVTGRPLR